MRLEFSPRRLSLSPEGSFWNRLREPRVGVMLHYDGSKSDDGGLSWLLGKECGVSYNLVVGDDGSWGTLAPLEARAWHAGVCRRSATAPEYEDANSAFYAIAALTDDRNAVTAPQLLTIGWLTARLFVGHPEWEHDPSRIVGHSSEAWTRGRKVDPEGGNKRNPILSVRDVAELVPLYYGAERL